MAKPGTTRIEKRVRSIFPDDVISRVQVLEYGDDPAVEPGDVAVRVFFLHPDEPEDKAVDSFESANREHIKELNEALPHFVAWLEFQPDGSDEADAFHHHILKLARGGRARRALEEAAEELTPVMTRLGPADLATVDTLITAGIASSRAEVLRWAVGRIRENPAYEQLQNRVREIDELKAQFLPGGGCGTGDGGSNPGDDRR
jgi:hypothetical protein